MISGFLLFSEEDFGIVYYIASCCQPFRPLLRRLLPPGPTGRSGIFRCRCISHSQRPAFPEAQQSRLAAIRHSALLTLIPSGFTNARISGPRRFITTTGPIQKRFSRVSHPNRSASSGPRLPQLRLSILLCVTGRATSPAKDKRLGWRRRQLCDSVGRRTICNGFPFPFKFSREALNAAIIDAI